ncbi:MAG: hypothetical protein FJ143_11230 [Deltaproteobacteria bacterium]|nr:hypothetical protein [Deltaproteobacteria bacterium]
MSTAEWELARKTGKLLPVSAGAAARAAKAHHRNEARKIQIEHVIDWLQSQHDIDLNPKCFDQDAFEKFYRTMFNGERDPSARRRDAVKQLKGVGIRAGRGGSVTWKEFRRRVCAASKTDYSEKTIRRDYDEIR